MHGVSTNAKKIREIYIVPDFLISIFNYSLLISVTNLMLFPCITCAL